MGANCTSCLDPARPVAPGRKQPRARKNTLTQKQGGVNNTGAAVKKAAGSKRKPSRTVADTFGSGLTSSDRTQSDDAARSDGVLSHWKSRGSATASTNPLGVPSAHLSDRPARAARDVRRPTMEFTSTPPAPSGDASDADSTTDGGATAAPHMFMAAEMQASSPPPNSFTMVSRHSTGMSHKEGLNETMGPEDLEAVAQAATVEDGVGQLDMSLPFATTTTMSVSGEQQTDEIDGGPLREFARTLPITQR